MSAKPLSSSEKDGHYLLGIVLLIFGALILALGLFGVNEALTSYYTSPGLGTAAIIVTTVGGSVIWLAISLIREARQRPTRSY